MDMNEPDAPDIDRRLREAFDDDDAVAARIARAALADEDVCSSRGAVGALTTRSTRGRGGWAAVAAGAAVLLVASAVVWWPAPPLRAPGVEPPEPSTFSGFITDGALVVPMPDGSILISAGEPRTDRLPDGFALVMVEGALR